MNDLHRLQEANLLQTYSYDQKKLRLNADEVYGINPIFYDEILKRRHTIVEEKEKKRTEEMKTLESLYEKTKTGDRSSLFTSTGRIEMADLQRKAEEKTWRYIASKYSTKQLDLYLLPEENDLESGRPKYRKHESLYLRFRRDIRSYTTIIH